MTAVVYAETFGNPSEVWLHRQVRALGLPLVTHEHRDSDTFPYDRVHVVRRRRTVLDRGRSLWRRIRGGHRYGIPRSAARELERVLARVGAKTVFAHYGPAGLRMAPIAARAGCRLVVAFHGFDATRLPLSDRGYRRALVGLLRHASAVAVSGAMRTRLLELGCPGERVHHIPLGVPVRPPRAPPRNEAVRVLTVARLEPVKGIPDLVDAVVALRREGHPVELDIVGDGSHRAEVTRGASQGVRVHGWQSPDRVQRFLEAADIFVLNSRRSPEGDVESLGISLLEAMERGVSVIGTRHGGIPEVVRHEETGLLVGEGDTDALQKAILRLARDPDLRASLGQRGRAWVEEHYDVAACTERLRTLLEEASAPATSGEVAR